MKKKDASTPQPPELRVLDGQDDAPPGGDATKLRAGAPEDVEVLRPDRKARLDAKAFRPDVSDILGEAEEEADAEEKWGSGTRKMPPLGWLVLAGILVTGLALWAVVSVYKAQPALDSVAQEKDDLERARAEETAEAKETLAAMERALEGYLAASTVDEKIRYVRQPERVGPLMRAYYSEHPLNASHYARLERMRALGLESFAFAYVQVVLADGSRKNLVLQQMSRDSFAVDWETEVCYQPMDWGDYLRQRPPGAVEMRVKMRPDNFHAYEFRDEEQFDCYRLTARGHEKHLFGFVRRDSKVAKDLAGFVEANELSLEGAEPQPLLLRIRFPEGSPSRNCVWIEELVAPRWLVVGQLPVHTRKKTRKE